MQDTYTAIACFVEPEIDADSASFWAAANRGELLIQRCADCGRHRWPARAICPWCASFATEEVVATGRGRVYSWTVIHHASLPTPPELLPYCVVLVALDEDASILMPGQLEGDPDDLSAHAPVEAVFRRATDDIAVVHWRLAPSTT